jgi:hypothetical protein
MISDAFYEELRVVGLNKCIRMKIETTVLKNFMIIPIANPIPM